MLPTFEKWTFYKGLYRESYGPSINMGKMARETIISRELMLNAENIIPYRPSHRAIDKTLEIPEKVLAISVSVFYQTIAV